MIFNPFFHHRQTIRLRKYDYSLPGAYFITICTHQKQNIFGDITAQKMNMNAYGKIAKQEWKRSAELRKNIKLDEFIVMPNHLHGIVIILDEAQYCPSSNTEKNLQTEQHFGPKSSSIGAIVAGYKSAVTKKINVQSETPILKVWQRNFYERVIRDESELNEIRRYILDNPNRRRGILRIPCI